MPASASAIAIARPTRIAPPVTSARPVFLTRRGACVEIDAMARVENWLKSRFIAGFFFTVPVFATGWILWRFWSGIDDIFAPIYTRMLGRPVPGLGFLTAVAVILVMGALARNLVARRVLSWRGHVLL